ncbi:hypothetical protein A2U01_0098729, partial [Trifolium medium]|nr:hypothetical protein [Trifolium medium]
MERKIEKTTLGGSGKAR